MLESIEDCLQYSKDLLWDRRLRAMNCENSFKIKIRSISSSNSEQCYPKCLITHSCVQKVYLKRDGFQFRYETSKKRYNESISIQNTPDIRDND